MLATIQFTSDFMRRLRLAIHGRVQGVFFRHGARQVAERLGLVGFVKNCPNGCVEVLAEGDGESLKKLRDWCKVGPPLARVERVEEEWAEIAESTLEDFRIV